MSTDRHRFGRIVVDETGIARRKRLFGGNGFHIAWGDLESWAVTDTVLASLSTGQERLVNRTLELHSKEKFEIVPSDETGRRFDEMTALLRRRCPEKEKQSLLAMFHSVSHGGPDAMTALLQPFEEVLAEELARARKAFPEPTPAERSDIIQRLSRRVADIQKLSARHANQIVYWYCEKHAPDIARAAQQPLGPTGRAP
jgi:hypothetical protein